MPNQNVPDVKPGDGATIFIGSDRVPATVLSVSKSRMNIVVQEDSTVLGRDGLYEFSRNPDAAQREFSYRKGVGYVAKMQKARNGTRIKIGVRDYYYDPSF